MTTPTGGDHVYTFTTTATPTLDLDLKASHATIVATDTDEVTVEVRPAHAGRQVDREIADETTVRFDNGRVSVRAPGRAWYSVRNLLGAPPMIQVTIRAPIGTRVDVRGEYGDITGEGSLGTCSVETEYGSLRFDRIDGGRLSTGGGQVDIQTITGPVEIRTGDGTIRLGRAQGPARLKTANGHITVAEATTDLRARTDTGSIGVGAIHTGTIDLETLYGPVEVGLPAGVQAYVDASADYGTVHNRLEPAPVPEAGPAPLRLRAHTAYGDIVLRRP